MDAITAAMTSFFWGYQNFLLPVTIIFWFAFKITQRDKALFITSVLLVAFNLQYIYIIEANPGMLGMWLSTSYRNTLFFPFFSLVLGIWGIIRTLRDLAIILKGESVVDQWNMIIEQAAGKGKELLDATEKFIKESRIPNTACFQDYVSMSLFGQKRQFLMFYNLIHQDYKMYISARNIGTHLDVSWFATIEPRLLKRTLSKYMMGDPQALSQQVDMFDQQDLRACFTVAHHCLQQAIDILLEELKQQPLGVRGSPQSKGFLSVW